MIGIYINDNAYEQDIRELLMAFFPGETFVRTEDAKVFFYVEGNFCKENGILELKMTADGHVLFPPDRALPEGEGIQAEMRQIGTQIQVDYNNRFDTKNKIKRRIYAMLAAYTGKVLPWGTLTGIRPTKIAMTKLEEGSAEEEIRQHMRETYFTSEEKIELSIDIAKRERRLLSVIDYQDGYSLYIGIPFCPTTCLYCSFTSYPIGRWEGRMQLYLDALYQEMGYVAERMEGRPLDTVYFGGGTPTSLSAQDLDQLIVHLKETFDCTGLKEFTVEAGRPDSITEEKLLVLKRHGVTRISINPQTMKQETLDIIGRRHTVEQVRECFGMARKLGFDNINMDLIIGLPQEEMADVLQTMEELQALNPDSITVHSLAIKRAAKLNMQKEQYAGLKITNTQEMIDLTASFAKKMGMEPYYLYRQKNMAGNFENVGYAKPGKACIYNILIMEEKQTIAACGAGTTTKVLFSSENRIERAENVKDVDQYIERVGEMMERKERLLVLYCNTKSDRL